MQETAIRINNLSKKYKLGTREHSFSIKDNLLNIFKKRKPKSSFWALKDVKFEVKKGEVLGIIGKNGSGKSTLLKILSRITPPTQGEIQVYGKTASLLEVGTGFHPELTGRENIYLNGSILGMTRKEIDQKFSEIVSFSEIDKFLDTPVKRYSSGMYVRLAFAVAAHLEPEILIIDEVLAVGDAQFQKKCLGKMRDVAKGGRTVLFVSHNIASVNQLCSRCILLEKGKIIASGETSKVTEKYLTENIKEKCVYEQKTNKKKDMNLRKVILNPNRKNIRSNNVYYDEDIKIRIYYEINKEINNAVIWLSVQDISGVTVFCSADHDLQPNLKEVRQKGEYQADMVIPKKLLSEGSYVVSVGLNTNDVSLTVFDRVDAIEFTVVDNGTTPKALSNESSRSGIIMPFLQWKTEKIKDKNE